ncbi:nucleotidyltransferase family protein [Amycolatopsis sp. NPDC054798]
MNHDSAKKEPALDLAMIYEALDVPEEDGLGLLMAHARNQHYMLPGLVLSVIERAGVAMGPVAAAALARWRQRQDHYRRLLAEVSEHVPVEVIKGPNVSRYYPDWALRPQGDLDLLTRDERDLWAAAKLLARDEPLHVAVSVFGRAERHLMVTMTWDPPEPLIDPRFKVEISTAALTGDFGSVPIRRTLPRSVPVGTLLCVAEERLQRSFHARDALDLSMLSRAGMTIEEIVEAAAEYRLAPELAELVRYSESRVPLNGLAGLEDALAAEAERENRRRAAADDRPVRTDGSAGAFEEGRLLHGMPLGRSAGQAERETSEVRVVGTEALLLTPLGDYLLVEGAVVDPERYAAVLEAWEGVRA